MKRSFLSTFAFAALAIGIVSGCAAQKPKEVQPALVFGESTPAWRGDAEDTLGHLHDNSLALDDVRLQSDLSQTHQCLFTADFGANTSAPSLRVTGVPGDSNFSLGFAASGLAQAGGTTNPCGASLSPTEVAIDLAPGLAMDKLTGSGSARVVTGGTTFTTEQGYFEFKLVVFDQVAHMATATFRFVMTNESDPHDPRVLAITNGSFTTPLH